MHVAFDLGEKYTYLVAWEPGHDLDQACIRVMIPGPGPFDSDRDDLSWSKETLCTHLAHLQREYLLPSRKTIHSAALAVPGIWSLASRRTALHVMEEILGLDQVPIIPRPLALAAGFNLHCPVQSLSGDVLLIQELPSGLDMALLSLTDSGGMVLERQFGSDPSGLEPVLTGCGYSGPNGSGIDQILISSVQEQPDWQDTMPAWAQAVPIQVYVDPFTAADGLFGAHDLHALPAALRFSVIYPFEFCLTALDKDPGSHQLQRIPFDTANLELDCAGSYPILNLYGDNWEKNLPGGGAADLRLYAFPLQSPLDDPCSWPEDWLILEIDTPMLNQFPRLQLQLDMLAANVSLEAKTQPSRGAAPAFQPSLLTSNYAILIDLLKSDSNCSDLAEEWASKLLDHGTAPPDLAYHLQNSLFRLHAIKHILSE
ncbi:MAG: hypothetical protein ABRQ23_03535 [Syntrophomonadaceae bacterium]